MTTVLLGLLSAPLLFTEIGQPFGQVGAIPDIPVWRSEPLARAQNRGKEDPGAAVSDLRRKTMGQSADALCVLEPWLARHPDDDAAQQLIARARASQSAAH